MTTRITKLALLSTASAAAAAFALPSAAAAQSTTCTPVSGSTTTFNCVNGATGISTITVTAGTFDGTVPLTISSSTGDITATAVAVNGGTITNTTGTSGTDAILLSNTFANGAVTLNATGQNISTTGVDVDAIDFRSSGGVVNVTAGNLTTTGDNSYGIIGGGGGATTVTVGNISATGGTLSTGADIDANGNIVFTSGAVTSAGDGLRLDSNGGNVTATAGAINSATTGVDLDGTAVTFNGAGVTVTGAGDGVVATGTTGPVTLRSGAVTTANGDAIVAVATTGAVDIGNCPTVATTGAANPGISATTTTGAITINCGAVTTAGAGSDGVIATSGTGAVSVTTTSVNTGNFADSDGVVIDTDGAVTTNVGTITVRGEDSMGLSITGGPGNVTAGFGNVTTAGDIGSTGVMITTTSGNILLQGATTGSAAGNVVIEGDNQVGVELTSATGTITGAMGNITATAGTGSRGLVVNGGTATTAGSGLVNLTVGNVAADQDAILIDNGADPITLVVGNVSTTEADAPVVTLNSTGAITLTGGTVTGGAAGSDGVTINGGAGAISSTVGAVTVTGADSDGITINGTGTINSASGLITTVGADSIGLDINGGAGAITATTAGVSTNGANSDAVQITGAGPVTFTNTGTITVGANGTGSNAIDIATTGTGAVNVTTGVITSASTDTGAVSVVAAGAAPVTLTVNGNVTSATGPAILAQSAGTVAVTVNQGATVTGPTALNLAGATGNTLVLNGTLTSTTANTPGFVVTGAGPLNLTLGAQGSFNGLLTFTGGNDTFTNNRTAGFTQAGALDFGAGNDTFTNTTTFTQTGAIGFGDGNDAISNSGVFNIAGTIDFGAGTDSFTNTATGTVNVTAASSLLGLETLTNAGTFNQNFALTFDAGNTAVTNSGTMNVVGTTDFGAGTDTFTNSGTLNVRGGNTTFAGLETFTNAGGIIDLRDGAANDTFNISGNYVATGNARLGVDVVGAGNTMTSDLLVIGGTTTGTTTVLTQFSGTRVIDPVGTRIVDSTPGTITAGQFVLGADNTQFGLINYALEVRSGDVFLTARPDDAAFDQLFVGRLGNDIWYQSAEAYQAYAMSRRVDYGNERKGPVGLWGQLYGGTQRSGDRDRQFTAFSTTLTASNRFETDMRGAQVGLDFGAQNFIVGVTAGYERAEGDSDLGTEIVAEGYNYGAYAQFGAEQGLYAGVLLKRDDYDLRLTNAQVATLVTPEGRSTGIDGEVGFRFGNPGGINFDLGAGLSYVRSRIDDYSFGGINFETDRMTSTRGRLQARASFAGTLAPFIDAKVFREFGDENELTLRSGTTFSTVVDGKRGTWARIEAGLGGGTGGGPLLSAFVDLGDVRGYGLRGGFRF